MQITEYFSVENKEHWLSQIKESDWDAAQFLYKLLLNQELKRLVGESTKLLMLTEGEKLIAFCTLADKDDIQPTELTPWLGWIYTFPAYRGKGYARLLLEHAEMLAKEQCLDSVYISTNHIGLYEKYGYEFLQTMKDIEGEDSRVYIKHLI